MAILNWETKYMDLFKYFIFLLEIGLFIEFLLTPEKVEIMIPLKIFYAMTFLTIAGLTNFLIKRDRYRFCQTFVRGIGTIYRGR
jgi:hypothetical protein